MGTEVSVPSVPVVSDSKVHIFDTFGYVLVGRVCVKYIQMRPFNIFGKFTDGGQDGLF